VLSSCTDDLSIYYDSAEDDGSNFEDSMSENEIEMQNVLGRGTQNVEEILKEGNFVIVEYDKQLHPGLVVKLPAGGERGKTVECMMSLKKCWKW
jgi:hypothetical protein